MPGSPCWSVEATVFDADAALIAVPVKCPLIVVAPALLKLTRYVSPATSGAVGWNRTAVIAGCEHATGLFRMLKHVIVEATPIPVGVPRVSVRFPAPIPSTGSPNVMSNGPVIVAGPLTVAVGDPFTISETVVGAPQACGKCSGVEHGV